VEGAVGDNIGRCMRMYLTSVGAKERIGCCVQSGGPAACGEYVGTCAATGIIAGGRPPGATILGRGTNTYTGKSVGNVHIVGSLAKLVSSLFLGEVNKTSEVYQTSALECRDIKGKIDSSKITSQEI
jgi:hypothetical protein